MGGFFNIEGPFYRVGNMVADIIIMSLVWLVFSLPIVTCGAATTALFYVSTRRITDHEGYLLRDFWKSFRANFKQSTIVWLIMLLVGFILLINIRNIELVGDMKMIILPFQICFLVELVLLANYIFPLIARFDMKLVEILKTSFFMANKHIVTSITLLVMGGSIIVACLMYELLFLAAMGLYAFGSSYFIMKIFKKYRPEIDKDDFLEAHQN